MPPVLGALAAGAGIVTGVGAPLALASFTTVGIAAAAGAGGLGIFGNLALGVALSGASALLSRASARSLSAGVNSNEVRLNSRQETPPIRVAVGEVLLGGALAFEECKPPFLYLMLLLSEGPITSLVSLQNSQTRIGIDPNYRVLTPPYTDRLFVSFRNGSTTQAIDPILQADFPGLPDATFRQLGISTLVVKADYGNDYDEFQTMWGQAGKPNLLAKVRGVPVYDPRDPSQVEPPDRRIYASEALYQTAYLAAQATWQWSNNATLVQAWYALARFGGRMSPARARWDKIAESADWDDGLIGTLSGELIKRHTIDGVITAGQEPFTVLQSMLTANRGMVIRSSGEWWIQSSQPQAPILTVNDDMIVGGIEYRRSQPKRSLLNRVRARFIDPRQDWQTVDGPVLDDTTFQASDGNLYEATAEFAFTADHRRAQRLARCHMLDSRLGREITTTVSLDAIARCKDGELDPGRVVTVDSAILPRMNGNYRIMEVGLTDNANSLEISLAEYDPSIELDWNPETDEQPFDLPDLDVS